jgi:WD40 repeat protein
MIVLQAISGGDDGTLHIWDVVQGNAIQVSTQTQFTLQVA